MCKHYVENKNPVFSHTVNGGILILTYYYECNSKRIKFIK